jgi:hypothetical protein
MRNLRFVIALIATNVLLLGAVFMLMGIEAARARTSITQSVPHLISYQGALSDGNGNPINGTKNITVKVYSAASGGTAIWTEAYNNLAVANGVFTVLLGSNSPLPDTLFDAPNRWLEINVEGVTLTPRQQFTSVPYTLNAEKLDGQDSSEFAAASHAHAGSDITSAVPTATIAMTATYAMDASLLDGKHASELGETWNLGEANVDYTTGVLTYGSYAYYSNTDADFINNFYPPSIEKKIGSTSFLIVQKSGSYTGNLTLVFEVRDFNGSIKHIVSAANVIFSSATPKVWVSVPLSSDPTNLIISPGEYLVVHVHRNGAPAGDLQIIATFQAEVQ